MTKERKTTARTGTARTKWGTAFAMAAIFALAALLAACDEPEGKPTDGGEAGEAARQAAIELEGNPTTGYSWSYAMSPEGVVREVSHEYRQRPTEEGIVGAGGVFSFVFEGVAPGRAEIRFSYARPWEDAAPAETVVYTLDVDQGGNITAQRKD